LEPRSAESNTRTRNRRVVICICGMAGSGKSTLAKKLAEKYGLAYYSGGDALKALASEKGYKIDREGWWESQEGMEFLKQRMEDLEIDKKIDVKLLEWAKRGNVIFDSWTMPWLLKEGFKIWLDASEEVRAQRVARRDGIGSKEALNYLREKESKTRDIYKRLYGFDLGEDFTPFHLVLDVNSLNEDEAFQTLCMVVENILLRREEKVFS